MSGIMQACKKAVVLAKESFPLGELPEVLLVTFCYNALCMKVQADIDLRAKRYYVQHLRHVCHKPVKQIITCPGYSYHLVHVQTSADAPALAFAKQHECDDLRVRNQSFVVLMHWRLLISDCGLAPRCISSCETPRGALADDMGLRMHC